MKESMTKVNISMPVRVKKELTKYVASSKFNDPAIDKSVSALIVRLCEEFISHNNKHFNPWEPVGYPGKLAVRS